jgi:SAM-dependent methyltransferase
MIDEARRLADEHGIGGDISEFEVGDAERITMPDASIDGVICRNVLDFVSSPGSALGEIWRVLKPGCRLVLSVLGANSPVKRGAWRRFLPEPLPHWDELHDALGDGSITGELRWEILGHRPDFGPAASGASNEYTAEMAGRWEDRIVQQTLATVWEFVIAKPAVVDGLSHPRPGLLSTRSREAEP